MKRAVSLRILLSLFGGASAPEYKTIYEEHEREFKASNPFTSHRIQRDGHFLYAREFGEKNKGQGPSIVSMHGFPDNLHLYDELLPYLIEKRHVIVFDFLGWGNSDKPSDHMYTSNSLKKDLEAVVQYFNLDNVVIVTHDASGPTGIDWALENESKINALILLNSFYQPMPTLKAPEAIALFSTPSIKRSITILIASYRDSSWQGGLIEQVNKFISNVKVREKYTKIFAYQALEIRPAFLGLNKVLREEIESRRELATDRLSGFRKPVFIVFGSDDPYLNSGVRSGSGNLNRGISGIAA